jgi:HK97 family phage major capsid protein
VADGSGNIDIKTAEDITREIKALGENAKGLHDSTQRDLATMRAALDEHGKKADALVEERVSKFAASVETKQMALESGQRDIAVTIDQIKTAMNRTDGADGGWKAQAAAQDAAYQFTLAKMANAGNLKVGSKVEPNLDEVKAWTDVFAMYMRRDERSVPQAALTTGSDPDGGYLVPEQVSQRIVSRIYETSPMRDLAYVEKIGGKELEVPRDEGEFGYGWVGEQEARPETSTSQLGLSKITAHEMYAAPRATQNMLEDAAINIEEWIARKLSDKFGRVEASAFLTGDGVGKPRGLLTYPAGTANGQIEQVVSGAATDFTFDGLINLIFSLKDGYDANASFLLNRLGLRNVSRLKDTQGRYLWEPGLQVKGPSMLLGYPVKRATDIAAPAAGALMAAFGDFKQAYTIVDRLGITTLRDPFTAKPYVIFYSRRRVGGDVVNFEAVKLLVGST